MRPRADRPCRSGHVGWRSLVGLVSALIVRLTAGHIPRRGLEDTIATVYPELDERLIAFIASQPVFFVATAPCLDSSGQGSHVTISPKGYADTFAVIDPLTVAYLDLTGSGAETIAHLRQNGRITIMFCSLTRAATRCRSWS